MNITKAKRVQNVYLGSNNNVYEIFIRGPKGKQRSAALGSCNRDRSSSRRILLYYNVHNNMTFWHVVTLKRRSILIDL